MKWESIPLFSIVISCLSLTFYKWPYAHDLRRSLYRWSRSLYFGLFSTPLSVYLAFNSFVLPGPWRLEDNTPSTNCIPLISRAG